MKKFNLKNKKKEIISENMKEEENKKSVKTPIFSPFKNIGEMNESLIKNFLKFNPLSIEEFNSLYSNKCEFFTLLNKKYPDYAKKFLDLFPTLQNLIKEEKTLFPFPIELLETDSNKQFILTRKQAACLLTLSFFGLLNPIENEKLNCFEVGYVIRKDFFNSGMFFINYLLNIEEWLEKNDSRLEEKITYIRNTILPKKAKDIYNNKNIPLCDLAFYEKGSMFDSDATYIVDFANEYIGGGVLRGAAVQEEILFLTQPELICSMSFMEVMSPNDAIRIDNSLKFSNYTGYSRSFKYENNPRIIAMDAVIQGYDETDQFNEKCIQRDIHKSFVCFNLINFDEKDNSEKSIATGNWGCGAFGGDHELKFIQQWISASFARAQRLEFYSFGDRRIENAGKYWKQIKEKFKTAFNLHKEIIELSKKNKIGQGNTIKKLLVKN